MKFANERSPRLTWLGKIKPLSLATLIVAGLICSWVLAGIPAPIANAITDAQKAECVAKFPSGARVATAGGTVAEWTANECDKICTTKTSNFTGITTSEGCDPNKVASDDQKNPTDDVLKEEYGKVAASTICKSGDTACATKIKAAVSRCIDKLLLNGYEGSDAPVYPDMNTSSLASCMSTEGYSAANVTALTEAFGDNRAAITKKAQAANNTRSKEICEAQEGFTWNEETTQCDSDNKTSCAIDGIGWLVCPAMLFMADVTDGAYSFLATNFLSINTEMVTNANDAWARFRDIANILFVIALLAVVYSQITSIGITNYGIKKMLPRIVVAAVLVNLSFIICQVAVDLSNILGYGVSNLFVTIDIGTTEGVSIPGWATVIGAILAIGAGVGILLALSVPVLLSALLAVGLIVLILVGRQALIVLLVAIAPLAFVAYLLPNTEQWFKKWAKLFSTLLLLFPIIGLVFGASRLAANIVNNVGGTSGSTDGSLNQLIALGITAIPFFVVPGLLKGALNAAGSFGTKLSGMADKASGAVGARVKDSSRIGTGLADMKKYRDQQRAIRFAKSRGTGVMGAIGRVPGLGGAKYAEKTRLRASSLESEEYEDDVKAADTHQAANMTYKERLNLAVDQNASKADRDAAIRFGMNSGNFEERRSILEGLQHAKPEDARTLRRAAVGGARAKGDTGVFGASTLGALEDGDPNAVSDVKKHLDSGATKRIEDGEVTPEVFARDTYTAKYLSEQAKSASAPAQQKFADTLTGYAATEAGQKLQTAVKDQIWETSANTTRVRDVDEAHTQALAEDASRSAPGGGTT